DGGSPEPRGVPADGRVDARAAHGRGAGDAAVRLVDRDDRGALFDDRAAAAGRGGVAERHRGRIAVARLGLVEHGTEPPRSDPRLHPAPAAGLGELAPDAGPRLAADRRLELRSL